MAHVRSRRPTPCRDGSDGHGVPARTRVGPEVATAWPMAAAWPGASRNPGSFAPEAEFFIFGTGDVTPRVSEPSFPRYGVRMRGHAPRCPLAAGRRYVGGYRTVLAGVPRGFPRVASSVSEKPFPGDARGPGAMAGLRAGLTGLGPAGNGTGLAPVQYVPVLVFVGRIQPGGGRARRRRGRSRAAPWPEAAARGAASGRVSAVMPYGGREAAMPRSRYSYRRQCHGHRPAEGGSPTNRTREHAGGMSEGKAPNQSADWRERRSKGLGAQAERWPGTRGAGARTAPSAMPTAAELRQCPLSCFPFFGPVRSVSGGRGKKRLIYEAKTSSTRV